MSCNNYSSKIKPINEYSVLGNDFMPAVAEQIDIQNDGLKFVAFTPYLKSNHLFTIIYKSLANIVDGVYLNSMQDGPFKYVNKDGKQFALLTDMQTGEPTLASSDEIVELTRIDKLVATFKDGLYDGFQIMDNLDGSMLNVLHYKDIFFVLDNPLPIILDARKPKSGLKTKVAIASAE
jgi:hypothetical protein